MSDARTIWHDLETRRSVAANRQWTALLLGAGLLIAMCAGEVVFLNYVAGPDTINILSAAEGMPVGPE
jgi:ABC-type Fe3+-siderophore transport system permease subunit